MSKTIDTRVVELEFDHKQFESGVRTSLDSLEQLNKGLDLTESANRMSASAAIITGAFIAIGEKAVEVGMQLAKAITLDPLLKGLSSYESQIGSVQVIMNATGKAISEVEATMDRLVWFADETSYSMDQMTTAVSRFVSNNVDLEKSATAIQGIATMAALAGVNGQNASIAFNNIADAIAKGGLSAIDYKSLELAGITTTEFKKTAIEAGISIGALGEKGEILNGRMKGTIVTINNFKETLSAQASEMWFSNEVIMKQADAFGAYATAVHAVQEEQGLTANQAMAVVDALQATSGEIDKLGKKAFLAAQESKTLTDSLNYTRDALASGWATSWKLIFGNYDEARFVFTGLSDLLYEVVVAGGDARNEMLGFWKEAGGRQDFLESLDFLVYNISQMVGPIKNAFRDIFPKDTGERLVALTKSFRNLMAGFKMGEETTENLRRSFRGLFAVLDIAGSFVKNLVVFVGKLIGVFAPATSSIFGLTGGIGDFLTSIRDTIKEGKVFENFFGLLIKGAERIKTALGPLGNVIKNLFSGIGDRLASIGNSFKTTFSGDGGAGTFADKIKLVFSNLLAYIKSFGGKFSGVFGGMWERIRQFSGVGVDASFLEVIKGLASKIPSLEVITTQIKNLFNNIGTTFGNLSPTIRKVWDVIGPIFTDLVDKLKLTLGNMDLSKAVTILNSILNIGLLKTLLNLTGAFGEFSKGTTKVLESFAGVLDQTSKTIKAFTFSIKAKAIKDIAISLGILAAALIAMSFVDVDKLGISLGIMTIALGELIGALYIMSKIDIDKASAGKITALAITIIGLSAGVLLLASAMKKLADLSWKEIKQGLFSITILLAELVIAAKILGSSGNITSIGLGLLLLSTALLILSTSLIRFAGLDSEILAEGLAKIAVSLVAIGLSFKLFPKNVLSISAGLLVLSVALTSIAGSMLLYSKLSFETLVRGLSAMAATLVVLGLSLKAVNTSIKDAVAFTVLSIALTALVVPLLLLSKLSIKDIGIGLVSVAATLFTLVVAAKAVKGDIGTLTKLGAALTVFAGGFKILSIAMKGMDDKLFKQTLIAVGMTALLLKALSRTKEDSKGAIAGAISMLLVFSGLAVVFHLMAAFSDVEKVGSIAMALSGTMLSLSAVMFAISKIDEKEALKAVGVLALIELLLVPLGAILIGMSMFMGDRDPTAMIPMAIALGLLMAEMAVTLGLLSLINEDNVSVKTIGIMALLGLVLGEIGVVLALVSKFTNVDSLLPITIALGGLMAELALVAIVIGKVKTDFMTALETLGIMVIVIAVMGAVMVGLGLLAGYTDLFAAGTEILRLIGVGIGEFVGGILGGIVAGAMSVLPQIGRYLSEFMENSQGFIEGIRSLDKSVLDGVGVLVGAFLLLMGTEVVNSLLGFLTGGINSKDLADQLSAMGEGLQAFAASTSGVDSVSIKDTAEAMMFLMQALKDAPNSGGMVSWFTGNNDAKSLGKQIVSFGEALSEFDTTTANVSHSRLQTTSETMKALFEALAGAPNTGGMVSWFTGDNSGEILGEQLVLFGNSLSEFDLTTSTLTHSKLKATADTMKALFESLASAPNTGGMVSWFTGENSGEILGAQLVSFGGSLAKFDVLVERIDDANIISAAETIKSLFEALKDAPNTGGFIGALAGENGGDIVGPQLTALGSGLKNFSNSAEGINNSRIIEVSSAIVPLFEALSELPEVTSMFGNAKLSDLSYQLWDFGSNLKNFYSSIVDIRYSTISDASGYITELFTALSKLPDLTSFLGTATLTQISSQLPGFGENLKTFANSMSTGVISNISNALPAIEDLLNLGGIIKDIDVTNATWTIGNTFVDGLMSVLNSPSQHSKIKIKMAEFMNVMFGVFENPNTKSLFTKSVSTLFSVNNFVPSGESVVDGIIKGINNKKSALNTTVEDLGKGILISLNKSLDAHSPSKETEAIGGFAGQGLITGLKRKIKDIFLMGSNLGNAVQDGMRDALEQHSPPPDGKGTNKIAQDSGQGVIDGLKSKKDDLVASGKEAASSLTGGMSDELINNFGDVVPSIFSTGINKATSEAEPVAADGGTKIGNTLVNSTSSAIKENMSAEEAAKTKAESIVSAFSAGLSKLGDVLSILDLEYQLFEKSYGYVDPEDTAAVSAKEAALNAAKLETATKQLTVQNEKAVIAQEIYNQTLAEFGAESEYTRARLQELYQEQIKVVDMINVINDLNRSMEESKKSAAKGDTKDTSMLDKELEYINKIIEIEENLSKTKTTFTKADIEKAAAAQVGYDPDWKEKADKQIESAVVGSMSTVQSVYSKNVEATLGSLNQNYGEVGAGYAEAIGTGMIYNKTDVTKSAIAISLSGIESASKMAPAWKDAGAYVGQGFADGIISKLDVISAAGARAGEVALAALAAAARLGSPSKETIEYGRFIDAGLAIGLLKYAYISEAAGGDLGDMTMDALREAMSNVVDVINSDMDLVPTVRPVIDMSLVQQGVENIKSLFDQKMDVSTSYKQAAAISSSRREIETNQNGSVSKTEGAGISLVQNNYSPKALTRLEIYRQTKNQISTLKGLVT